MRIPYLLTLWFLAAGSVPALAADGAPWDDANTPRLEIRQYRFSKFSANQDRLVLEFERKDQNFTVQPKAGAVQSELPREYNVQVENALLLGAIPESLINDSFAKKSRFLGAVTVDMESPKSGFSMKTSLKGGATHITAQWLQNPARLVIDAFGGGPKKVARNNRQMLSIERAAMVPAFKDLMCFPAQSKVELTVVFRPQSNTHEEMQNIRVNTNGTTGSDAAPASDAIVCYPRHNQIVASLSFEEKPREMFVKEKISTPAVSILPETQPQPAGDKTAKATTGDENELDPGRNPTSTPAPAVPPSNGEAMPLPPGLLPLPAH